jgi:uncharacterized protein YjbI with pentapeptide repeats
VARRKLSSATTPCFELIAARSLRDSGHLDIEALIIKKWRQPMKIHHSQGPLDVRNADITESCFVNAKLCMSRFDDVNLESTEFTNANLAATRFSNVNFSQASIEDADLTGMKINGILVSELLRAYRQSSGQSTLQSSGQSTGRSTGG